MLIAVMDLGSNSFKMTVARWAPDESPRNPFCVLHKERHPIQLGGSVFASGRISERDFKEGLKALAKMQSRLREFASPVLRVVATSAIRDSENGREFVQQAREQLGLAIEVIPGAEEARLIGQGLQLEYPEVKKGLLVDIGGGSSEVATFGPGWAEPFRQSFRIGSVRVATRCFKGKKPKLEDVRRIVRASLKLPPPVSVERLVGSAGAIQSIGKILSPGRAVPVIRLALLDKWIQANLRRQPGELARLYSLMPSRARIVVPGAIVLSEILHWLGRNEIHVTGMTLRDGLLVDVVHNWQTSESRILKSVVRAKAGSAGGPAHQELMRKDLVRKQADRALLAFVERIAQRFAVELTHASHITALALSVFDQMVAQGARFSADERRLLLVASYLHDIGKIVSEAGHQKHGAYIIRNLRLPGFSPLESKKAALVALYHRKETPPKKDPLPGDVNGIHADQVRRMTALLRLADGLDEHHGANVRAVRLRLAKKQVLMELQQSQPDSATLDYFRDKAAYFEELFGLKIVSFVKDRRPAR